MSKRGSRVGFGGVLATVRAPGRGPRGGRGFAGGKKVRSFELLIGYLEMDSYRQKPSNLK